MSHIPLTGFVETASRKFNIPGVAVGVWADGKEISTRHGVTSIDNPLAKTSLEHVSGPPSR